MISNQLHKVRELAGYVAPHFRTEAWPSLALFMAGVFSAITEGMGITMLIPMLSGDRGIPTFSTLPVIGRFADVFAEYSMAERLTWMAWGLMAILLVRGGLTYAVGILKVTIPMRVRQRLAAESYKHLLCVGFGYVH